MENSQCSPPDSNDDTTQSARCPDNFWCADARMCCQELGAWLTNSRWKPHHRPDQSSEFNIDDGWALGRILRCPAAKIARGVTVAFLTPGMGGSGLRLADYVEIMVDIWFTTLQELGRWKISQHWFLEFDAATIFRIKFGHFCNFIWLVYMEPWLFFVPRMLVQITGCPCAKHGCSLTVHRPAC